MSEFSWHMEETADDVQLIHAQNAPKKLRG